MLNRRLFLQGLAASSGLLVIPELLAGGDKFFGDDFVEGHTYLSHDHAFSADDAEQGVRDVIVVGAGVAGLATTHRLQGLNVLCLERAKEAGGVAKSREWRGIRYCVGSAYFAPPAPEDHIAQLVQELNLHPRLAEEADRAHLQAGRLVAGSFSEENLAFLRHVRDERYPALPPDKPELLELDRWSFEAFLKNVPLQQRLFEATCGPLSQEAWQELEGFCWGAMDGGVNEISAYPALNFLVAELEGVYAFPGGNSGLARALFERVKRQVRLNHLVLQIRKESGNYAVVAKVGNRFLRYRARAVVLASPLFLAKHMLPLPPERLETWKQLEYRGYVVASLLLNQPLRELRYSFTPASDAPLQADRDAASVHTVFSDGEISDWANGGSRRGSVLTLYCPFPYRLGKSYLMTLPYERLKTLVLDKALEELGPFGLVRRNVAKVELTRWGHAMLLAKPGLIEAVSRATEPLGGAFFAHTDVFGSPAIENSLAAAWRAAEQVRAVVQ